MNELSGHTDEKVFWRHELKARRAALNESARARASWQVCRRLTSWLITRPEWSQIGVIGTPEATLESKSINPNGCLGVYLARPFELSLDPLIQTLFLQHKQVAAPRVNLEAQVMDFWQFDSLSDLENGAWNVREPQKTTQAHHLPIILVPGLAFDAQGGRLGMGGGWYDRFLASYDSPTPPLLVGVGFDCQIIQSTPLEEHDHRVHYVVTDEQFIDCSKLQRAASAKD